MIEESNLTPLGGLVVEMLARGHCARFRATGDSMYPTIRDGDVIDVEPVSSGQPLRAGEILLVEASRGLLVHRFVASFPDGRIVTRGDNSAELDEPVIRARVLGRVTRRERHGHATGMTGGASLARQRAYLRLRRIARRLRRVLP